MLLIGEKNNLKDSGFSFRNYRVQELVAQNFSSAEKKEFSTQNPISRENILEKSSHSWVKENQENCHHQFQSKGIA